MNKYFFFSLLFLSTVTFARTTIEVLTPELDDKDEITEASDVDFPTPLEALRSIKAGKLTYMGRDLFPGNDQNRTCVYKSDLAYILYNNCLSSKKESSATDIEIIGFDGNITNFYIQNKDDSSPISTQVRSQYSMTWRVGITPSDAPGNLTLAQLKAYKEKYTVASSGGCFIGKTFEAQNMDSKASCLRKLQSPKWTDSATAFWLNPDAEWYEIQKYLRQVVVGTKF